MTENQGSKPRHPDAIPGFDSADAAAAFICNLRYDVLADLLGSMARQLDLDAAADLGRGRPRLSESLVNAAVAMEAARHDIEIAWRISEPHMR